jgi:DNA-binding SARP family transcriptional activator/Tfp pilus assembly protein PilF
MRPLNTGLSFVVLGPVGILVDGRQRSVARAQARGVLALLALNAGRALSRQAVADALWGDTAPTTARAQVQNAIHQIRGVLADAGHSGLIETASFGYRLCVEPEQVDAGRFDRLLGEARNTVRQHAHDVASRLFRAALDLCAGEPLLDAAGAFVESARARLNDARLTAVEDLADLDLSHGRPELVADELAPIVHAYPVRERLRSRLMLALYRSGRPSDALRVCREYRQLLAEREGLDPGPEITELEMLILRGDPSLTPRPAAPVATFATAAPEPHPMPVPAQLPPDPATFTGRTAYLDRLDTLLPGPGPGQPIVISAVSGAAGFGKTALAVHWGHRVRDRFPDGQLFVDLQGYSADTPLEPVKALARFLRALGVPPAQIPDEVHEASGLFRSLVADRRLLLLLDNARGVEQVRPLLPGSPTCLVVVTSRDRLDGLAAVDGADRIDLDVLQPDEAHALLRRLIRADRVDADRAGTIELARLCAYLPLALRIAAARLNTGLHRRVADLVAELSSDNRLSALAVRGDERAAIRATFELSYRALPPAAQRVFRLIGLVPGPDITVAAVAALVGADTSSAGWQLATLTGAHLVDERDGGRFTQHDLLRAYAKERAHDDEDDSDRTAAWHRLLGYYLSTVEQAARLVSPQMLRLPAPVELPDVDSFPDAASASAWLDAERSNLVAAVRRAAEVGPRPSAWLLADALRGYFTQRICAADWRAAAEAGLAAAETEGVPSAQAAGHLSLGALHLRLSRYPESIRRHATALSLAEQGGWLAGQAATLNNLATLYHMTNRPTLAAEIYTKALALNRQAGDLGGEAVQLGNLGALLAELGHYDEAMVHVRRALNLYRKTGARSGEGWALSTLGSCYQELGLLAEARELSEQGLVLLRELGDRTQEIFTLRELAVLYAQLGRHAEALDLGRESLTLAREVGHPRAEAGALMALGEIHRLMGESARCVGLYEDALAIAADGHLEAEVRVGLAAGEQGAGDPTHARRNAERALATARESGYLRIEGIALTVLARVDLDEGRTDDAIRHAHESATLMEKIGCRLSLARSLLVLGLAVHRTSDTDTATAHWRRALDLFVAAASVEAEQARALLGTAEVRPA